MPRSSPPSSRRSTSASPRPWKASPSFGTSTVAVATPTGGCVPAGTTTAVAAAPRLIRRISRRRSGRAGLANLQVCHLSPAQPARDLLHRASGTHHRVPRLQRVAPRGPGQDLHTALPRPERTGPAHQGRKPDASANRQPEVHLPVLAPAAGLHRRRIRHRPRAPAPRPARQRRLETGFLTQLSNRAHPPDDGLWHRPKPRQGSREPQLPNQARRYTP